jgi:hypothetical protein
MEQDMSPNAATPLATPLATPSDVSQFTIHELMNSTRPSEAELVEQNERLKGEVDRMVECQRDVMKLLDCKSPERIIHDLRNLINELNLYRQLVESSEA